MAETQDKKKAPYNKWATEHELLQGGPESFYDPEFWSALSNFLANLQKDKADVVGDNVYHGIGFMGRGMLTSFANRMEPPTVAHMMATQDFIAPWGEIIGGAIETGESFFAPRKTSKRAAQERIAERMKEMKVEAMAKRELDINFDAAAYNLQLNFAAQPKHVQKTLYEGYRQRMGEFGYKTPEDFDEHYSQFAPEENREQKIYRALGMLDKLVNKPKKWQELVYNSIKPSLQDDLGFAPPDYDENLFKREK